MGRRWILLALPVVFVTALLTMGASALSVRFEDPRVAFDAEELSAVSRHPVPEGIGLNAGRPLARFWLVRQEHGWKAFADRETGWRGCPLEWRETEGIFVGRCWGSRWGRTGRAIAGREPRDLDQFAVTETSDGWVIVDLSRLRSSGR